MSFVIITYIYFTTFTEHLYYSNSCGHIARFQEREQLFLVLLKRSTMGCPCANPPGKGSRKPVQRNPMTLQPINSSGPLTRKDIRSGRIKHVERASNATVLSEADLEEPGVSSDTVESKPPLIAPKRRIRQVMGGFLSNAFGRSNRRR